MISNNILGGVLVTLVFLVSGCSNVVVQSDNSAGAVNYQAWGDSMTCGAFIGSGCGTTTSPNLLAYPTLVATNNAWSSYTNQGVSADMCPDTANHILSSGLAIAPGQVHSLQIGFNDNYFYGSVNYRLDYYQKCQEALIAYLGP